MAKRVVKVVVADPQAAIKAKFIEQGSDPVIAKKALDDATGLTRGLWLSFLIFGTYLVITFAGVDHRDLLLEEPITLPVLNAPLPLVIFFWVAPILFVIFHLYLLLSLKLLADQVHHYLGAMAETGLDSEAQDRARLQLPNFVVVQVLGGTSLQLNSWAGWLMRFTAFLTLAAGPLILLLFAQLMFLPYHGGWVTMAQRLTVILDLVFIWYFWRAITRPEREGLHVWGGMASATVVVITFFVFMYPGEKFYGPLPQAVFPPSQYTTKEAKSNVLSNTIELPGERLVDDDLINNLEARNAERELEPWEGERSIEQVLSGRDFRNADFNGIDLRRANLSGSKLDNASLIGAKLQGTNLDRASLVDALLDRASLQGASLREASLERASLQEALLQGAQLDGASLKGASLRDGMWYIPFASGPYIERPSPGAQLQGASLFRTTLHGANLDGASLQGAALDEAKMQGASLERANLQGASLDGASLQGASLAEAKLEGASFDGTSLDGATLGGATVWRNLGTPDLKLADLSGLSMPLIRSNPHADYYGMKKSDYETILAEALSGIPKTRTEFVRQRIAVLDPLRDEPSNTIDWPLVKRAMVMQSNFKKIMIESLTTTACDVHFKPYVATEIIEARLNGLSKEDLRVAQPLIERLLAGCPGAEGLDQWTIDRLMELKEKFTSEGVTPEVGEGK